MRRIGFDRIQWCSVHFERDIFSDHAIQKSNQAADYSIQVHRARLQNLPARKRQQLLRQRRRPLALFANARKPVRDFCIFAILLQSQFRPAENRSDHIVEIVRDAPGKLSDGFEFLRLVQLSFQCAKLGYVLRDQFNLIRFDGARQFAQV